MSRAWTGTAATSCDKGLIYPNPPSSLGTIAKPNVAKIDSQKFIGDSAQAPKATTIKIDRKKKEIIHQSLRAGVATDLHLHPRL